MLGGGGALAVLLMGIPGGLLLIAAALAAALAMRALAMKQIQGYTGDVLGAVEQVAEITVLIAAAALLS